MPTPPPQSFDLITLLVALLVLIMDPAYAKLLAPYVAIIVAACAGAVISVSGPKRMMFLESMWYLTSRVLVALTLSAAVTFFLQPYWQSASPQVLLVLVAFGIGAIRDFEQVRKFFARIIAAIFLKRPPDGNDKP